MCLGKNDSQVQGIHRGSMEDAFCILPRLWIGNRFSAISDDFLQKNRITSIFNCSKELPFSLSSLIHRRHRIAFGLNNELHVYHIIQDYHRGEHILIHEYEDFHTCATFMTMALMLILGEPSPRILLCLRSKRIILPNHHTKTIEEFEKMYIKSPLLNI